LDWNISFAGAGLNIAILLLVLWSPRIPGLL
jgi:hypothetical protein